MFRIGNLFPVKTVEQDVTHTAGNPDGKGKKTKLTIE
jgi:hypothetical protein